MTITISRGKANRDFLRAVLPQLRGIVSISSFAIGKDKIGACITGLFRRQGIDIKDIYIDNIAKIRLLGMNPTLETRANDNESAEEILSSIGLSAFMTEDKYLYVLGDKQNIAQVQESIKEPAVPPSPPPVPKGKREQVILTPEQVLTMYRAGRMPPIGSSVKIFGGRFLMGGMGSDREPVHAVEIPSFLLSPHAVTNQEFEGFIEAGGYRQDQFWSKAGGEWREKEKIVQPAYWNDPKFNQPKQPVVGINWFEAEAYLSWAGLRFPTEAEWEYAARGGLQGKKYPWGDMNPRGRAHFSYLEEYVNEAPVLVDSPGFAPNGFGLYHMAGNVWEWVFDWYSYVFYQECADGGLAINPNGPLTGDSKVQRGGSWDDSPDSLDISIRFFSSLDSDHPWGGKYVRENSWGFRAARDS